MEEKQQETETELKDIDVKFPLLEFEKQIFIDIFEKDALVIMAKGLNYTAIINNFIWIYNNPSHLVLVVNSSEHEERCFTEKFNLSPTPTLGPDREKAYLEGGVHFVTTRILVVDLLKNRVPISHVTGVLVLRAHTVLESCQEAFALRLYRQKNKTGFIKAFSNSPISFTYGYHQVEKVMRALFVTELFLWPRFHGAVLRSLRARAAPVEELRVPLSPRQAQAQAALLLVINATIKQLKSLNRTVDMQEITAENCITAKFHKILQAQLDGVWHQLGPSTRQLVQDLRVLRQLLLSLVSEDAVSFLVSSRRCRSAEYARAAGGWLLLDAADQLFSLARSRVFTPDHEFDPEPCPKWTYLTEILTKDIPEDVKKQGNDLQNTKILVLCQDSRACAQINHYLTMGASKYLLYTALRKGLNINKIAAKYRNYQSSIGKDKVATESSEDFVAEEEEAEEEARANYVLTLTQGGAARGADDSLFEPLSQLEELDVSALGGRPLVAVRALRGAGPLEPALAAYWPHYVVLYHSDAAAVRQLEVFECRKPAAAPPCRVYLVVAAPAAEEQAALAALRREKQAFELLIQTKSVMVVPSYQDGKTDEFFTMDLAPEPDARDTRRAGGQQTREAPVVVVDMREFRCELPALLHRRRLRVEPLTIQVGDYVLSPEICVERKSLSDLVGSLASGRLCAQAAQLCRAYSRPVLLIEFDQNKPFNLQGGMAASSDAAGAAAEARLRLQLLTLHFPRLKLVWSPSPYATADLFAELKEGRSNPDVAAAAALSGDSAVADLHERHSAAAHDLLRRLPGGSARGVGRLLRRGGSMPRLAALTQDELAEIMENKKEAYELYTILHMKVEPEAKSRARERPRGKVRGKNVMERLARGGGGV